MPILKNVVVISLVSLSLFKPDTKFKSSYKTISMYRNDVFCFLLLLHRGKRPSKLEAKPPWPVTHSARPEAKLDSPKAQAWLRLGRLGLRPGWLGFRPGWMALRGADKQTDGQKIYHSTSLFPCLGPLPCFPQ